MKDCCGKIVLFCALAVLGGWSARGQVVSPSAAGVTSVPEITPAASPAAAGSPAQKSLPMEVATPALTAPAVEPSTTMTAGRAAASGSFPMLTGTAAALTGTAPVISGTSVVPGTAVVPSPAAASEYSIEIDLTHQRTYLLKDGKKMAEAPVSSGRAGHLTPVGNFEVIQKDLNHFSNLYGKIVEKGSGRVVKSGADVATPVPKGCKFVPAPMKWFMRFEGAAGMHAGILPGYPASHGCVRMPASKAELFFNTVALGTPVHVFGTPPLRAEEEPRHHEGAAVVAKAAPVATPAPKKKGWLFF
jgi:lipoprotein-anchoring transpeptidase ErfK/SrfK